MQVWAVCPGCGMHGPMRQGAVGVGPSLQGPCCLCPAKLPHPVRAISTVLVLLFALISGHFQKERGLEERDLRGADKHFVCKVNVWGLRTPASSGALRNSPLSLTDWGMKLRDGHSELWFWVQHLLVTSKSKCLGCPRSEFWPFFIPKKRASPQNGVIFPCYLL